MGLGKSLLNQEYTVLDNVINKLQIYMDQSEQTLYGLASSIGFNYQPFYRIMTKKHLPNLNSLSIIASHFKCSVSELINDEIFLDVECFNSFNDSVSGTYPIKIRIYIPINQYLPLIHKKFFAVKSSTSQQRTNHEIFYYVDDIVNDGIFLVKFENKNILLEVLSVSSKYIIACIKGKEIKIDLSEIKPIGRFFNYLVLVNKELATIIGVI